MLLSDRYRAVSCDRSRSPHRFRREMPYRKREYGQMRSRRKREQSLIDPTKSHHYEQRKTIVPGHREIFESPHVGHRVRARDPDAPVDILARETATTAAIGFSNSHYRIIRILRDASSYSCPITMRSWIGSVRENTSGTDS